MRWIIAPVLIVLGCSQASATTCSEAIKNCIVAGGSKNIVTECKAAGAYCMKTGTFIGAVTNTRWDNLVRH